MTRIQRHEVLVEQIAEKVRIIKVAADPPSSNLIVQRRIFGNDWSDLKIFNDMSDDFAHSHARAWAHQLAQGAEK